MNNEHSLMAASAIQHEAMTCFQSIYSCSILPSVLYRPSIARDGNKWCALYGENLQAGVAGFGDSPMEAMSDFDKAWYERVKP